jgi:hypothetical protein
MSTADRTYGNYMNKFHCQRCRSTGGGGDSSTWSEHPATQTVNLACNDLSGVESVRFCDGTYMGPGGSFDISSSQVIDITSLDTSMRVEANGTVSVVNPSTQGVELVCFDAQDNTTSIRGKSVTPFVVAQSANSQGQSFMKFDNGGTGITIQAGGSDNILLDATGATTIQSDTSVALSSGGNVSAFAGGASMTFTTAYEGTHGQGTTTFQTGNINISNEKAQTATMSVRVADGEFEIESAKGVQIDVNSGVATLALRDTAGVGSVILSATSSVDVFGQTGVFAGVPNGSNPSTGLLVAQNEGSPSAKLIIDNEGGSAGLQYDGAASNRIQFHFTHGSDTTSDFLSTDSSGFANLYLVIYVNERKYKIKLESD